MKFMNFPTDAIAGHRLFAFYYLAIMTGLRKGELSALKWSDVDFSNKVLSVRRTMAVTKDGPIFQDTKTGRSRRSVVLPGTAVQILKEHRISQAEEFKILQKVNEMDLVFTGEHGQPLHPKSIINQFNRMIKKADVSQIRFHDLRHTHATILLQQGIHPKVVSERLGHSQISITMDTYSHVLPGLQEEASRSIENAVLNHKKDG
jgi:integrase